MRERGRGGRDRAVDDAGERARSLSLSPSLSPSVSPSLASSTGERERGGGRDRAVDDAGDPEEVHPREHREHCVRVRGEGD